jgi:cytochrome c556
MVPRSVRVGLAVALLVLAGRAAAQVDLPVAELDPHFRGGREGHAYTLAMLELGMRMGAATTAALRDDRERALSALKSFREHNAAVAKLVPSWKEQFKGAAISDLEAAVSSKADLATRRKLVGRIEQSCTSCHARYMFPVQARYRWGSFANATVPGDDAGTVSVHQHMLDLANSLGALRSDVEAGQLAEAQTAYKKLTDRFNTMEQLCVNCHDQPRQYFIDQAVKARIYRIGGLLRQGEKRGAEYAQAFKDINAMSCLPCHQVHMPAAFQQAYLKEKQ